MKQFLTAAFILFLNCADAQYQVGFKTGARLAALEPMNEKATPYKRIITPDIGAVFTAPLLPGIYLQGAINYITQGGKRTGIQKLTGAEKNRYGLPANMDLFANLHNRILLNYLEVPVLLKLSAGNKFKYYMSVGPYVSWLVSAKQLSDGASLVYTDDAAASILKQDGVLSTTITLEKTSTNIRDDIKKINLGIDMGWGLEYKIKQGSFFTETRLSLGATNVQAHTGTNGKTQTTGILMSAGYMINIK